jgi:hypothetical protein
MTKYELSLTKDYVPDWTLVDAMRELFQNALDQETTVSDNKMFWEYHEDVQSFHIGNKLSILEPRTLLLGGTTKANDENTIGKFGEGYKIATLVLTRLGKKVTFFNYGAREVWRARFSKSKKYGEEILVFEVDKTFPWKAVPNNNLTIVVEGITEEESFDIGNYNLHMQEGYKYYNTSKGRILLDEDMQGKMFVNGLYICTRDIFKYGYDFKPSMIKLDRDRKLIQDFDLKWLTSQMWIDFSEDDDSWDYDAIDTASRLVQENAPDVRFMKSANYMMDKKYHAISENVVESFKLKYGENAVPVSSQYEAECVPETHRPIIVTESYQEVIKSSPLYIAPAPVVKKSLHTRVEEWLESYIQELSSEAYLALKEILEDK